VVFAHQGVVLDSASIFHVGSELALDVENRHALEGELFNTLPSHLDFTSCEPQTLDILHVENLLEELSSADYVSPELGFTNLCFNSPLP
jgi:hypothetical protein